MSGQGTAKSAHGANKRITHGITRPAKIDGICGEPFWDKLTLLIRLAKEGAVEDSLRGIATSRRVSFEECLRLRLLPMAEDWNISVERLARMAEAVSVYSGY
jgi:hypothetical protein